jgi:hypothetical protein
MRIEERKKEMIKDKIICLCIFLFLSLYLLDEGKVNYIKNGTLLYFMSSCAFIILKINSFYIQTGKKPTFISKDLFLLFKLGNSKIETYNDILSIMMLLAWLISLCLVLFGAYHFVNNFFNP